jgi:hypothetical protein
MPEFLVEAYSPPVDRDRGPSAEDVAEAAGWVAREGRPVRLLHTILLPEDETCLYLFEAESIAAVAEAANRAGLRFERSCQARSAWTSGTARRFASAP